MTDDAPASLETLRDQLARATSEYDNAQMIDSFPRMLRERRSALARMEYLKKLIAEAEAAGQ